MSIAAVATCKGRLEHLMRSAPLLLGKGIGYVLVDWGCPQNSGTWLKLHHPEAHVVRTEANGFEKTRANNLGAQAAIRLGYDYLLFVDADTILHPPALAWLTSNARPDRFLIVPGKGSDGREFRELIGILLVPAAAFTRVGGFDTSFGQTYGHEDMELRLRLWSSGLGFESMPTTLVDAQLVSAIPHSNELRVAYYPNKNMDENARITLQHLERRFESLTGKKLGVEQRGPNARAVNRLLGVS